MKILWLANIPSPYRVGFFNELGKKCELTVLFEREASSERDESWRIFQIDHFEAVFLKGIKIGVAEAVCPSVVQYIRKGYDHIVVSNFYDPTGMIAIQMLRFRGIPYELEGDGAFPGTGKGMKEKLKKYFISGADRYFSTAELHDQYYLLYGAEREKLYRYPFTSVYEGDVMAEPYNSEDKKNLRDKLGITEDKVVLSVGQFIPRKGFDILIKAAEYLDGEIGIYIIGGKPLEEYVKLAGTKGNIHFLGFKKPTELTQYYQAADVFAHPAREDIWGLVVNEAMANGIPVVTTDRCIAGMEMVRSNDLGRIVSVGSVKGLADAIKQCLEIEDKRAILSMAKNYTIEKMVTRHLEAWGHSCKSTE